MEHWRGGVEYKACYMEYKACYMEYKACIALTQDAYIKPKGFYRRKYKKYCDYPTLIKFITII